MEAFAAAADLIAATASTRAKAEILAAYLAGLDSPDALRHATIFMGGRPFGRQEAGTLQVGWATVAEVIRSLSGADETAARQAYRRQGDLGAWAAELLSEVPITRHPTVAETARLFSDLREAEGAAARVGHLRRYLQGVAPEVVRYVVKIIAGELRIGLAEGLIEAALARAFSVPPVQVRRLHMLTGDLGETAVRCQAGRLDGTGVVPLRPVRFMLAAPVGDAAEALKRMGGDGAVVWIEEKYDGVRCQLHVLGGTAQLYSRDLRPVTTTFPEIAAAASRLERDLVVDGELLAHRDGTVLPFSDLQKRLGRKLVDDRLRREVPVALVCFDLLFESGVSLIDRPLAERRQRLESLDLNHPFLLARVERATGVEAINRIFTETRGRGHEGLMIKNPDSGYLPGRRGLSWLKLKRPLATLDVVVTAVEWGHGKRAGVLSDYTFSVLDEPAGELVEIGKAYTGLTDAEIAEFTDRFLEITTEDEGWRRRVRPRVVLEVAFDAIQRSSRHRSGYALRFPRIVRIRDDKSVEEIDTLDTVRALHESLQGQPGAKRLEEITISGGTDQGGR